MNNADQLMLHIASQHGRQQFQESRMIASEEPGRRNPSQTFGTTNQHANAQSWIETLASQHANHQGAQQQFYQFNQQTPTQQLALQLSLLAQQARYGKLSLLVGHFSRELYRSPPKVGRFLSMLFHTLGYISFRLP
jgi:hypothetical protein